MKLEVLSRPNVWIQTIGKNVRTEAMVPFDKSNKTIEDIIDVLSGKFFAMAQHLHYAFYFHLPPDMLLEVLCYTKLRVSRDQLDEDTDEGVMSGSLDEFYQAISVFCQKEVDRGLRVFFNVMCTIFEQEHVPVPFNKTDLGDQTFIVRQRT